MINLLNMKVNTNISECMQLNVYTGAGAVASFHGESSRYNNIRSN